MFKEKNNRLETVDGGITEVGSRHIPKHWMGITDGNFRKGSNKHVEPSK
jgi:hypothetical protein